MDDHQVDAKLTFAGFNSKPLKVNSKPGKTNNESSLYYPSIQDKSFGKCLIFSFDQFKNERLPSRNGNTKDVDALKDVLKKTLGFDVTTHTNIALSVVKKELEHVSCLPGHSYDCVVVCFLSHGRANGILCAHDEDFATEELFEYFTNDKCSWLINKPKIFIIQACQGEAFDHGTLVCDGPEKNIFYKIPNYADFVVCYSSYPGFYSWRNGKGSWFIQSLCEALEEHHTTHDLMTILTITLAMVARCESVSSDFEFNKKKQIPFIASTLTRLIKFSAKNVN